MQKQASSAQPFLFAIDEPSNLFERLKTFGARGLESLLGLRYCQKLYNQIDHDCTINDFSRQALDMTGVDYHVDEKSLARIPKSGACIIVANHPYGGIDGLALINMISRIRQDFKVMGNFILERFPPLQRHLICVDPFGSSTAAKANIGPLRQATRALHQGELLVMFPAGEVSSWQAKLGCVADGGWSSTLARLVRLTRVPVQPVFFPGGNGALFHLAGALHGRIRTALLPRMLVNKKGLEIKPVIGHPIPAKKLLKGYSDEDLVEYLRLRTYALGKVVNKAALKNTINCHRNEVADTVDQQCMTGLSLDIEQLPVSQQLLESGDCSVYYAESRQIPSVLKEIGRLRELTFRQVGEGTGKEIDLDHFDEHYLHLFIWNHSDRKIVGAYRVGQMDKLFSQQGNDYFYSATLFNFQSSLKEYLSQGLELGRSFVCPEYQKSYAPLLMLWKGISRYLVANPQYRYLFGPVSISADYSEQSRQLMTSALALQYQVECLARMVSARTPVSIKPLKISGYKSSRVDLLLQDLDDVSMLVADFEDDGKGIPVLLRHYLNLGGKLLAFNLDPDFSDVIDGLLLIDVLEADQRQMQRYMGRDGYQQYLASHQTSQCA